MELPHIGQTCVICNRNDYLPFKCSKCDKIVCVDHKTDHGVECPLNDKIFEVDTDKLTSSESLKKACDYCKKITLKLELISCDFCCSNYCLYHRHQVQHDCVKLVEDVQLREKDDEDRRNRQKEALDRLKQATESRKQTPARSANSPLVLDPKNKALEKRVTIMRIKSTARGLPNILAEDKIYFQVKFQHNHNSNLSIESLDNKTLPFYTTGKHTVGRMIDWTANALGLTNHNHILDSDELVFMKLSDDNQVPIILESKHDFQHYLEINQLENGDTITLKYNSK